MKAWALWSARVDMYSHPELIEVFTYRADADAAKAHLIGQQRDRRHPSPPWKDVWEDDEDFPDLYVCPIELR